MPKFARNDLIDLIRRERTYPYRLLWEYRGAVRGQAFATWEALESFSRRLIAAGLSPWVPSDCPTPYDND